MQFLGVGWQEMALVFVLALLVVGPERMPQVAYQLGRAVRTLQQYARAVRNEFSDEISYAEEQMKIVRGEVDGMKRELKDQQQVFAAEMREATAPLQELSTITALPASNVLNFSDHVAPTGDPDVTADGATPGAAVPAAPPLVF